MTGQMPQSRAERPLSPHLQIYRPQLTSGISIFHRITAVGLTGGFAVLVAWLFCLAWIPQWHEPFTTLLLSPIGTIFLFGWTWAYFFHVGASIRHLLWDAVWCFSVRNIYVSGYIMLAVTTVLTFAFWIMALGRDVAPWL